MNILRIIKIIYLYIFSFVGLVLIITASVRLVNLALKTFIFTEVDQYYIYPSAKPIRENEEYVEPDPEELAAFNERQLKQQRQRDASDSLAMLIVGVPLYSYHWKLVTKKKEEE
ncbi:MAG TPA: hypothetical protein PLN18_00405 [Candidatus Colwellbacteria bacterium]|nr:hypothetical protein [Candidatus Colwellbacteria bacterium]